MGFNYKKLEDLYHTFPRSGEFKKHWLYLKGEVVFSGDEKEYRDFIANNSKSEKCVHESNVDDVAWKAAKKVHKEKRIAAEEEFKKFLFSEYGVNNNIINKIVWEETINNGSELHEWELKFAELSYLAKRILEQVI
jgi:hypothetical protein